MQNVRSARRLMMTPRFSGAQTRRITTMRCAVFVPFSPTPKETPMSEPRRIQRKRTKGWRMPEGAVYVGRGTRWGNPFVLKTRGGLARVPALDGHPWEREGRISAAGMQHDYQHADGHWTRHTVRYM